MLVTIVIIAVVIIIFIAIRKKNTPPVQSTIVFIGRDTKNKPVFEQRYSNGTSSINASGQYDLGDKYFNGEGVPQDYTKAVY
jgi:hypothetical protein